MEEELERIALRIRRWREEAGLTLQELADNSGVSASTIHKIENNNTVPTITVLLKVAHGLKRRPNELFEEGHRDVTAALTRYSERNELETHPGTTLERIVSGIPNALIDVWRVTHEPGVGAGYGPGVKRLTYRGELIVLVEEGELCVEVGEDKFVLMRGDTLHFKTSIAHQWYNQSSEPVSALFFGMHPRSLQRGVGG